MCKFSKYFVLIHWRPFASSHCFHWVCLYVKRIIWKVEIALINKSIVKRVFSGLQACRQYFWWSYQDLVTIFRWNSYNSKTKHTFSPCEHIGTGHSPSTSTKLLGNPDKLLRLKKVLSRSFTTGSFVPTDLGIFFQ